MPNPPRFVRVDPSQRKKQKVEQPQCQTCFNSFGTQQELRDHIADYQASTLEFQLLTARLLEVQAHLPRKHQNPEIDGLQADNIIADCITRDWDTEQENDDSSNLADNGYDIDDSDDGNLRDQDDDLTSTKCPHSRCRHKGRFLNRAGLERHFESHVQCHEICIYCRQLFQQTRQYIRHTCLTRQKANDDERDFYRKERCTQLKRISADKLNWMLASEKHQSRRLGKRGTECCDEPPTSPRKLRKGNAMLEIQNIVDSEGFDGRLNAENAMQVPFIAPRNLNPIPYPSTLSNATFLSKTPSVEHMQRSYDAFLPQPVICIFINAAECDLSNTVP
ncbi:hypothetical protein AAEP93_004144 [Penicillium crustosum]